NDLRDFSFTFLELPKFKKGIDQLSNMTEKWAYFFKHAEDTSEQDLQRVVGQDQIIERAYEELNRHSWNAQELLIYDQAIKYTQSYEASMLQKFDEGMEKGRAEGEKRGMEKGRAEGRAEGEKITLLMVAKNMLKQGQTIQSIKAVTGLSREEIES